MSAGNIVIAIIAVFAVIAIPAAFGQSLGLLSLGIWLGIALLLVIAALAAPILVARPAAPGGATATPATVATVGSVSRWVLAIGMFILLINAFQLGLAWFSPEIVQAWHGLSKNKKLDLSYDLRLQSMKTQAYSGTFVRVTEKTPVYEIKDGVEVPVTENGEICWAYPGARFLVNLEEKHAANGKREGFLWGIAEDKHGNFPSGNLVLIPNGKWRTE